MSSAIVLICQQPAYAAITTSWPGCKPFVKRVKVSKPSRDAGKPAAAMTARLDLVHRRLQKRLEDAVVLGLAALGDVIDRCLCAVDDVVDLIADAGIAKLHDAGAGLDQPPQDRTLGDDLRVVAGVGRGRHRRDQRVQVRRTADSGDLAALGQLRRDRHRIGGLATAVEVEDDVEDGLVRGAVEVAAVQRLDDISDRIFAQHHAAEHGLLSVDVLRRCAVYFP